MLTVNGSSLYISRAMFLAAYDFPALGGPTSHMPHTPALSVGLLASMSSIYIALLTCGTASRVMIPSSTDLHSPFSLMYASLSFGVPPLLSAALGGGPKAVLSPM